jgi:SAM-dependent methyltransferase
LFFAPGIGDMAKIGDAYVDWKKWKTESFGVFTSIDDAYYSAEIGSANKSAKKPECVLEIGFGNGEFLGWAASRGAAVYGVELNRHLVARAREIFKNAAFYSSLDDCGLDEMAGRITHLVAFDVLEHVTAEAIPHMLTRMRQLLRDDGVLILRFPNGDSPFGRRTQHGDPTHVTTLGREKLDFFARNAGLAIRKISGPALPLRGVGAARAVRRFGLLAARSLSERIISALYFNGTRVALETNYVAVLVKTASYPVQQICALEVVEADTAAS